MSPTETCLGGILTPRPAIFCTLVSGSSGIGTQGHHCHIRLFSADVEPSGHVGSTSSGKRKREDMCARVICICRVNIEKSIIAIDSSRLFLIVWLTDKNGKWCSKILLISKLL
jgi:hypothetical protein